MSSPPATPLQPVGAPTAMTIDDRKWAARASELELGALTAIRGLAEKWAASLTAGLGVVGLAAVFQTADKFAKLAAPWKAIAQVSFTLAVVVALVATGFAIAAAQGAAKRLFIPSGVALRDYSRTAVNHALTWLKVSRILAAIAACLVLVSGYCLWFGDRAKGSPSVIELPAGSQPCPAGVSDLDPAKSDADFVVRCKP
jgi:hypothetical protein